MRVYRCDAERRLVCCLLPEAVALAMHAASLGDLAREEVSAGGADQAGYYARLAARDAAAAVEATRPGYREKYG